MAWPLMGGLGRYRRAMATWLCALWCLWARPAACAGLVLAPPGVVSLGQGGAVVASTADPMGLVYNPGALAFAPNQLMLDGAVPYFRSQYTRRVLPQGPDLPVVDGEPVAWVVPNGGVVWALRGLGSPRVSALFTSDYPLVQRWPDSRIAATTPQRYATGGFHGTIMARALVGAAFAPASWLGVGASLQLLAGRLRTLNTLSACDGVVCVQPENPAYDATAALRSSFFVVPGFTVGAVARVGRGHKVALSYASGFAINSRTTLAIQLPSAPLFAGARMQPAQPTAQLHLHLPSVWRVGAAFCLPWRLHLEGAISFTPWHVHKSLSLDRVVGTIDNLMALGSYRLTAITVARRLTDTLAVHLALRRAASWGLHRWQLYGGIMLEPSASPNAMLSAMAVDLPKGMLALGASWRRHQIQFSVSAGLMGMLSRRVVNSAVLQINPTLPVGSSHLTPVGNGLYRGSALIVGAAIQYFY